MTEYFVLYELYGTNDGWTKESFVKQFSNNPAIAFKEATAYIIAKWEGYSDIVITAFNKI